MAEVVVSKKPKWGRIFRLTIGTPPNQIVIEDLFKPGIQARRISFDVMQAMGSYNQKGNIQVYNLSSKEVKLVTTIEVPVTLQAGYKDVHGENPPVIFTGNVNYSNSQRVGQDIVTTMTCFAYRKTLTSIPKLSYNYEAGVLLSQVFSDLSLTDDDGNKLPYQIIGDDLLSAVVRDDYNSGTDSSQKILDHFAINHNFVWWCDSITKQLIIVKQGEPLKKNRILLINAGTGLMKEPEITSTGLSFETNLEPTLRNRDIIRIQYPRGIATFSIGSEAAKYRELDSALNLVNSIHHSGDSRGDEWKTSVGGVWYNG